MFRAALRFMPCMRNQQQDYATGHTQGLPPLLAIFDAIQPGDMQRVVEYPCGGLKTDPVFALVFGVLCAIS